MCFGKSLQEISTLQSQKKSIYKVPMRIDAFAMNVTSWLKNKKSVNLKKIVSPADIIGPKRIGFS